jgi:hypothetical protein
MSDDFDKPWINIPTQKMKPLQSLAGVKPVTGVLCGISKSIDQTEKEMIDQANHSKGPMGELETIVEK